MRVLHVIPAVAARYGGPSAAVVGMCRALAGLGVETAIATTDADGTGRLPVPIGRPVAHDGVTTIFFPRRGGESFKWSARLAAWLHAHAGGYDLVHVHAAFSHSSLAAGRAAIRAGVPFVVRPLGTLDPWSLSRHAFRKRALLALGLRATLERASRMHYTSDEEAQRTGRALPWLPPGSVVPLGVEDGFFTVRSQPDRDQPYVLALSRLDEKKGVDLLITAFHRAAMGEFRGRWRLVIAGAGSAAYVERLRTIARDGAAAARINFAGWVEGQGRHELIRRASLFALPSHHENFGIALVEALAAGLPAVVTPGVNLAATIDAAGAGWRVDRDVASLTAALATAMDSEAERLRRGAAARAVAQEFRWPAIGRQLRSLYEAVCGERRSASERSALLDTAATLEQV